jgi:hypothetical protein
MQLCFFFVFGCLSIPYHALNVAFQDLCSISIRCVILPKVNMSLTAKFEHSKLAKNRTDVNDVL